MAAKRFVYWTGDGKRHWSPRLNITLGLSESARFPRADMLRDCRNGDTERPAPARSKSVLRREKAQSR